MMKEPSLSETIGLRHVIEDALAILNGEQLPETRRVFVIDDLTTLLEKAERGSQLLSGGTLFVTNEADAIAKYTLLNKLVGGLAAGAQHQLEDTSRAFRRLQTAAPLDEEHRKTATEFLLSVLASVTADAEWEGISAEPNHT